MGIARLLCCGWLATVVIGTATAQTPIGGTAPIGTSSSAGRGDPEVGYLETGELVTIWTYARGTTIRGIEAFRTVGRIFDPSGRPGPIRPLQRNLLHPVLAGGCQPPGTFQVSGLWYDDVNHVTNSALLATRFSALDGRPVSPPTDLQLPQPSLILSSSRHCSGNSLISWLEYDSEFKVISAARLLDEEDRLTTPPFTVFPNAGLDSAVESVLARGDGFLAIGTSSYEPASGWDAFLQPISTNGELAGPPLRVNTFVEGHQVSTRGGVAPSGEFVVVWQSEGQDGSYEGIYGQRFSADGSPAGSEFRINETTLSAQRYPDVAMDPHGNFAVTWQSFNPDPDNIENWNVFVRLYRQDGTPVSGEVLVSEAFRAGNESPRIAFGPLGTLAVVWDFCCTDTETGEDVRIRRFIASPGAEPCLQELGALQCDAGRTGGVSELARALQADLPRQQTLFGDMNGDGRDDVCAWARGWLRCDTDHEGEQDDKALRVGFAGDTILLADWDGDGRDDPCARRRRRFVCDVDRDRVEEVTIAFGSETDMPLAGDLDGDGRDEFCVARSGLFRCDLDHKGGGAELEITFAPGTGTPLLGDFDGNGTDDPCVFSGGVFSCDTAHDGGVAEQTLDFGREGDLAFLPNLDGL